MDGLEDQAEAAIDGIIDQLYTNDKVEIKHSSRDTVMLRVTEAIKNNSNSINHKQQQQQGRIIVAKKLVLRSGVSMRGLQWLEEALHAVAATTAAATTTAATTTTTTNSGGGIEELEFVCLPTIETVERAIQCCRSSGIKRLSLKNYGARMLRQNRDLVSLTLRLALLDPTTQLPYISGSGNAGNAGSNYFTMLESFEIANYPIGAEGAQILADAMKQNSTLQIFKLIDCDLRSDSATPIAQIIKMNSSLQILDLSYNRHLYIGSPLTREMTMKTLVNRGLKYNITLVQLILDHQQQQQTTKGLLLLDRTKVDQQLDMNRFRKNYILQNYDPMLIHPSTIWCHLLGRVSTKPMILYLFLQESVPTLLSSISLCR